MNIQQLDRAIIYAGISHKAVLAGTLGAINQHSGNIILGLPNTKDIFERTKYIRMADWDVFDDIGELPIKGTKLHDINGYENFQKKIIHTGSGLLNINDFIYILPYELTPFDTGDTLRKSLDGNICKARPPYTVSKAIFEDHYLPGVVHNIVYGSSDSIPLEIIRELKCPLQRSLHKLCLSYHIIDVYSFLCFYENASCPTPDTASRHRSMISDTENIKRVHKGNLLDQVMVCVTNFIEAMYEINMLTSHSVYGRVLNDENHQIHKVTWPGYHAIVTKCTSTGEIPAVCNSSICKRRHQDTGYVYSSVIPNEQNMYVSDTNGAFRISVSEPFHSVYSKFKIIRKTLASDEKDKFVRKSVLVNNGPDVFNNRMKNAICLLPPTSHGEMISDSTYTPATVRSLDTVLNQFKESTIGFVVNKINTEILKDNDIQLKDIYYPGFFGTDDDSLYRLLHIVNVCRKLYMIEELILKNNLDREYVDDVEPLFDSKKIHAEFYSPEEEAVQNIVQELQNPETERATKETISKDILFIIHEINYIVNKMKPEIFAICEDAVSENYNLSLDEANVRMISHNESMLVRLV